LNYPRGYRGFLFPPIFDIIPSFMEKINFPFRTVMVWAAAFLPNELIAS